MSTIQVGGWRKGDDGTFKVFIRGAEQLTDTKVEVVSRAGDSVYAVITGTYSKISGGYLYTFKYTRKPEPASTVTINMDGPQPKTRTIGTEISTEELDAALGLD